MNIKFYFLLFISIMLMGCTSSIKKNCSIKDLSGKCKSEVEVYKDSLDENKYSYSMPINISHNSEVPDKNMEHLNYVVYRTWVNEHRDEDGMLIGAHYIYWDLENNELISSVDKYVQDHILEPVG